jgi:hypothetical protein
VKRHAACAAAALLTANAADAQEYSRFLQCEGTFAGSERSVPAFADFALRFANRTALIQRSNVLPVGEKLQVVPTPASYSMTYRLPERGTTVVALPGWLQSTVLVLLPDLQRLNQIRIGIDRQTGALQGTLLNEREQGLGSFRMQCQSRSEQDVGAPKF